MKPESRAVDRSDQIDSLTQRHLHKDMPKLVAALRARDQQLGIAVSVENVA
jgi:hypothetical protein